MAVAAPACHGRVLGLGLGGEVSGEREEEVGLEAATDAAVLPDQSLHVLAAAVGDPADHCRCRLLHASRPGSKRVR